MFNPYKKVGTILGKRGAACLWFGVVFIIIGYSFMTDVTPQLQQNLHFLLNVMSLDSWGLVWILGGLVFLVAALWKRLRLIAFMVGIAITLNWSVGYAIQAAFGESSRGYVSAAIFGLFAVLILLISTWAEPTPVIEMRDEDDRS